MNQKEKYAMAQEQITTLVSDLNFEQTRRIKAEYELVIQKAILPVAVIIFFVAGLTIGAVFL